MNYKIAICDDETTELKYLSSLVTAWTKQSDNITAVSTFESAEAFLFDYAEHKDYDILLLDIEMGALNGVELAKQIRTNNNSVQIVFVTGYSDYIAEGYDVSALHYLMKPVNEGKLFTVLDRAAEKLKYNERTLILESDGEAVRILLYEIRYLEVRQNYVTVHAKSDVTVKKTLSELEKKLDSRFFRTGRSFIINLSYIQRVTKSDVYLSDGSSVPLPRGMYDAVNRAIINLT